MADRMQEKIRALSGGETRRVEITRALIHQPGLFLLDEATAGLDMKSRQMIISHIRGLIRQSGISVLWAMHLIDEVAEDDIVCILHKGVMRTHGQVKDIVAKQNARDLKSAFARLTGATERDLERF